MKGLRCGYTKLFFWVFIVLAFVVVFLVLSVRGAVSGFAKGALSERFVMQTKTARRNGPKLGNELVEPFSKPIWNFGHCDWSPRRHNPHGPAVYCYVSQKAPICR